MLNKNEQPPVDILLVTYNHEKFINQALESVSYQKYRGPIRVIVADDCSTDGTLTVITEFAKSNEHIAFIFLPSAPNIGITANYARGFAAAQAKYVAVLEGDDFWSSTEKLSKQITFLEEHRECVACACNYYISDERRYSNNLRINSSAGYLLLTPRSLIRDNVIGNFSTCVYRREVLQSLPTKLFSVKAYDWAVNICVSMQGVIGFLNEPLSVYRQHENSTWSRLEKTEKLREQAEIIPIYDELTGGAFHEEFELLRRSLLSHPELDNIRRRGFLLRRIARMIPGTVRRTLIQIMPQPVVNALRTGS